MSGHAPSHPSATGGCHRIHRRRLQGGEDGHYDGAPELPWRGRRLPSVGRQLTRSLPETAQAGDGASPGDDAPRLPLSRGALAFPKLVFLRQMLKFIVV
eukprot:CAMPEP_0196777234 /NCGR_PEP_ID=MMETSP1104-20130614/5107_1 /TAXON_ID=33652 /ORGANISM="Cafeteria sp., Strain Caron Lab Isolate" /LENGTH=98 /DNA_ID=CAMNT_0042147401 /DNA_START=266 /DNA_END=558 /DNA_ORIENTATION=+